MKYKPLSALILIKYMQPAYSFIWRSSKEIKPEHIQGLITGEKKRLMILQKYPEARRWISWCLQFQTLPGSVCGLSYHIVCGLIESLEELCVGFCWVCNCINAQYSKTYESQTYETVILMLWTKPGAFTLPKPITCLGRVETLISSNYVWDDASDSQCCL